MCGVDTVLILHNFYIWKHCWFIERNTRRAIDYHQRKFLFKYKTVHGMKYKIAKL